MVVNVLGPLIQPFLSTYLGPCLDNNNCWIHSEMAILCSR